MEHQLAGSITPYLWSLFEAAYDSHVTGKPGGNLAVQEYYLLTMWASSELDHQAGLFRWEWSEPVLNKPYV